MSEDIVAYALRIHGRVQGVGFRFFCTMLARSYKIRGWAKNCNDGTVETVCEGPKAMVDQYIAQCKAGCDFSVVDQVEVTPCQVKGYTNFRVKY